MDKQWPKSSIESLTAEQKKHLPQRYPWCWWEMGTPNTNWTLQRKRQHYRNQCTIKPKNEQIKDGRARLDYLGKPEKVKRRTLLTNSDSTAIVSCRSVSVSWRLRFFGIRSFMSSASSSSLESLLLSGVLYSRVDAGLARFLWRTLMPSSSLGRSAVNSTSSFASSGDIPTFELCRALSTEILVQRPAHGSKTLWTATRRALQENTKQAGQCQLLIMHTTMSPSLFILRGLASGSEKKHSRKRLWCTH